MIEIISPIIKYYLVVILLLSFCNIIGKLLLSFFSSSKIFQIHQKIFFQLTIGIVSIVTIYSIIITKFNTVNLAILILSLVFIFFHRDNIKFVNFAFSDIFKET